MSSSDKSWKSPLHKRSDIESAVVSEKLEQLCGTAIETSLQLRSLTTKGARLRKKKALVDSLQALNELGFSYKRSAVPAAERSTHAWFLKVS